jgi:alpha-beta hydrolase superfamily lysophospholipase
VLFAVTAALEELPPEPAPAAPGREALYFPAEAPRLFGWLHLPARAASDVGVVVCKPFGYEALCGHRSLRAFAEMAAAIGVPALRFDYSGSGDAADIDPDTDQIRLWGADLLAAIAELRRRTGVTRVCVVGFRLGALLAVRAALECNAITALLLIAPVLSGSRYVRELRRTRLAATLGTEEAAGAGTGEGAAAGAGALEVSGHDVSAASLAALTQLEAGSLPQRLQLLVLDRDDLPVARGWCETLRAAGLGIEYAALPGFVEMMMRAPQFAALPQAMLARARAWLLAYASPSGSRPHAAAYPASSPAGEPPLPVPDSGPGEDATERPVRFGPDGLLFGIVTAPRRGEPRRRAVVLVNNGADYHIGAARLHVSLARRWAQHGYVVLRMDLAGLGDSDVRPGRPDNEVFPPAVLEDVGAAIDFIREQYHVGEVTLGGVCSGAYHALRAASAQLPLRRIFMVNPETFSWRAGTPLEAVNAAEVVRSRGVHARRALSGAHWRKLLSGQADVARIATLFAQRAQLSIGSRVQALSRAVGIRLPNDVGWQFEQIAARGVRITIVFSEGEPGIELLRMQAGSVIERLGEGCSLHIIRGADHTFSRGAARATLERILSEELFARASS